MELDKTELENLVKEFQLKLLDHFALTHQVLIEKIDFKVEPKENNLHLSDVGGGIKLWGCTRNPQGQMVCTPPPPPPPARNTGN